MGIKKTIRKLLAITVIGTAASFTLLSLLAKKKRPDSVYETNQEEQNPMEGKKVIFVEDENDKENADGVRGHLEAIGESKEKKTFYNSSVKRLLDIILSFGGLLALSPIMGIIALAIIIDDPGPVLFTQKRIGKNKKYFKLHKFRSMKMSTPHEVPTHMLDNPDQYITKVGKFIRAHSLDELPQIWDIFLGNMSVIGPRPALWNQDVLTAERDKYGANDIKPGLTGWAQINGRDELELEDKARLDGEYVEKESLLFDIKCFLGTISKVGHDDSVVEGGTGEINKSNVKNNLDDSRLSSLSFCEDESSLHKRVLITGAGSYIGESFKRYAESKYDKFFTIDVVDMIDGTWREKDFSSYDIVFHVAGIAHADIGNVDESTKAKYYSVNTDLAIETAEKAKKEGVRQFVFMSSAIIYGDSAPYGQPFRITKDTEPNPANFYGDSKWQADQKIRKLYDDNFVVTVLRPPMIYGKGSKGNYPVLSKIARKLPVFPAVQNERSMLYIENLCEFLCQVMLRSKGGIFWPQNSEYSKTSEVVKLIAECTGHKIIVSKLLNGFVNIASSIPGKISDLTNKAFGNMSYDRSMSEYDFDYIVADLKTSIERTEE